MRLFLSKKLYFICTCLLKNILFWQYMTAKKTKKHFGQRVYYLQYLNCKLHSSSHLRSVFYRFETYDHALPALYLYYVSKNVSSKKSLHRRLKRNLSWVFRWKSVDITHHVRVRYTNYCIKIAKIAEKKGQENATKLLENRRSIACVNWPVLSWFAQYCRTTRVFRITYRCFCWWAFQVLISAIILSTLSFIQYLW